MKQTYLRDQRGVAMLFELVLVAVVLALAGLAVYQASHRGSTASVQSKPAAPQSAEGLAASAAAVGTADSTSDAAVSAGAEATVDEVSQTDADVTNLGGTSNAPF